MQQPYQWRSNATTEDLPIFIKAGHPTLDQVGTLRKIRGLESSQALSEDGVARIGRDFTSGDELGRL